MASDLYRQEEMFVVGPMGEEDRRGKRPFCYECNRRAETTGTYGPPHHGFNVLWFCGPHGRERWVAWQKECATVRARRRGEVGPF